MRSFFHKIANLKCGWNDKTLDENTFQRLCKKHKIRIVPMQLAEANGFYCCAKGKHYIAYDPRLSPMQAAFVMFHEFAHFLMHMPSTDAIESFCGSKQQSRDEKEADAFAYCALLPMELLKTRDAEELADIYGSRFFMKRLEVYERYEI